MGYNHTQNYFIFNGVKYGVGTIVKIKPEEYGSRREIERCNGIAEFVGGFESGYLKFSGIVPDGSRYCGIAIRTDPQDRIDEIIKPVFCEERPMWKVSLANYQATHPMRRADIAPGTIVYIFAMALLILMKNGWIGCVVATYFYLRYLINIYRD